MEKVRKQQKNYWEVRPTGQLAEALDALKDARDNAELRAVIGDTGCGKSFAIDIFKSKHPEDVFIVTVSQLDSIGDLLEKVTDLLGIVPGRTKSRKLRDIIARFRDMKADGRSPLLIFDECEYMKQPALCAVKEFYDNLVKPKYCGLLLAGHHQLAINLERMRKKSKEGIPQLYRRIKFGIRMLPAIDRKFDLFLSGMDRPLCRFLSEQCENYGELHDVLVPAFRESERTGEPLSEGFVRMVLNIR